MQKPAREVMKAVNLVKLRDSVSFYLGLARVR